MRVLVLDRDGDWDYWTPNGTYNVVGETKDFYWLAEIGPFIRSWHPKNGMFQKCQVISETD